MRIEIVNVSSREKVKTYYTIEVVYKTEGKPNLNTKKLMSFSFPEVFKVMESAVRGEHYEVTNVKDGSYWNWTEAKKVDAGEAPVKKDAPTRVVGSNYETPEEREWNRTRIIRQSCLNYAVNFKSQSGAENVLDILDVAAQFEKWVNRKDLAELVAELPDDIVD